MKIMGWITWCGLIFTVLVHLHFSTCENIKTKTNSFVNDLTEDYYYTEEYDFMDEITGPALRGGVGGCDTPPGPLQSRQNLEKVGKNLTSLVVFMK